MTNHMAEVAEMLGVKLGEDFHVKNYLGLFRFTEESLQWLPGNSAKWVPVKIPILKEVLTGVTEIVKLPRKPQTGELYFTPFIDIDGKEADMFIERRWNNSYEDTQLYKLGLVCESQQEAIDLSVKMLEVARGRDREIYK